MDHSFVNTRDFFSELALYSTGLMNRLPISTDIKSIRDVFGRLKPALDAFMPEELSKMPQLSPLIINYADSSPPAGMNTIGILADRLTILVCKEWYLRNRQKLPNAADEIRDLQIPDIVLALAHARPGHARLLEKVSTHHSNVSATDFREAYFGLLSANILMWETQEVLYVKDMESIPAEGLRDYIRFFSEANMMRNAFIAQSETLYWMAARLDCQP